MRPGVTVTPERGGLSACVADIRCCARLAWRRRLRPAGSADWPLGPLVRGGVGGEKDADRCVGEAVQLRCAEGPVIPAEHGLVQWLAQNQPGELPGRERWLVGPQESSLG